jgi:hypothetical protein
MPYAACPACKTDVKYPRDAELGTEVTCPECDEVFVPPELKANAADPKRKPYDPHEEEGYRVERPVEDVDAKAKTRFAVAAARSGLEHERTRGERVHKVPGWFRGPEIWLLIFAIGTAGGIPFGFWLAKNWGHLGGIKLFWLAFVLLLIGGAALGLGMGSWAWLRKRR